MKYWILVIQTAKLLLISQVNFISDTLLLLKYSHIHDFSPSTNSLQYLSLTYVLGTFYKTATVKPDYTFIVIFLNILAT